MNGLMSKNEFKYKVMQPLIVVIVLLFMCMIAVAGVTSPTSGSRMAQNDDVVIEVQVERLSE